MALYIHTSLHKIKDAHLQKIRIDDDLLRSRLDEVHGEEGLCNALIDQAATLMEMRLVLTYDDYLALNLSKLKRPEFEEYKWEKAGLEWSEINGELKKKLAS